MSSIIVAGDVSGTVTLSAPAVAGTTTLTLPATSGTVALTASPTFTGQATIPTINLTGGQITFPATAVPSADANCLDDYEEGTFNVAVRGSDTAGTYTITGQTCIYTKIGRLVSVSIFIAGFSTASGGSGYLQVTGLPFSNLNAARGSFSGNNFNFSANTLFAVPAFISTSGVTSLYLEEVKDNAGFGDFLIGGISTSSSSIGFTITYATT
jgi:hypothetical protein